MKIPKVKRKFLRRLVLLLYFLILLLVLRCLNISCIYLVVEFQSIHHDFLLVDYLLGIGQVLLELFQILHYNVINLIILLIHHLILVFILNY